MGDKIERPIELKWRTGKLMLANGGIREQVDAVNVEPFAQHAGNGQKSFHRRRGISNSRSVTNRWKQRLGNAALSVGHLQHCFAGDLIDGRLKRCGQRPIDHRYRHNDGHAEDDAKKGERGSQAMTHCMAPRDSV